MSLKKRVAKEPSTQRGQEFREDPEVVALAATQIESNIPAMLCLVSCLRNSSDYSRFSGSTRVSPGPCSRFVEIDRRAYAKLQLCHLFADLFPLYRWTLHSSGSASSLRRDSRRVVHRIVCRSRFEAGIECPRLCDLMGLRNLRSELDLLKQALRLRVRGGAACIRSEKNGMPFAAKDRDEGPRLLRMQRILPDFITF